MGLVGVKCVELPLKYYYGHYLVSEPSTICTAVQPNTVGALIYCPLGNPL